MGARSFHGNGLSKEFYIIDLNGVEEYEFKEIFNGVIEDINDNLRGRDYSEKDDISDWYSDMMPTFADKDNLIGVLDVEQESWVDSNGEDITATLKYFIFYETSYNDNSIRFDFYPYLQSMTEDYENMIIDTDENGLVSFILDDNEDIDRDELEPKVRKQVKKFMKQMGKDKQSKKINNILKKVAGNYNFNEEIVPTFESFKKKIQN